VEAAENNLSWVAAKILADQKARDEEVARGIADQKAKDEAEARLLADEQSDRSLTTLQMLIGSIQDRLDQSPGTLPLKRALLKQAMEGLNAMSRKARTAQNPKVALAAAHMRMAEALKQVGEGEDSIKQYEACHDIILRRAEAVRNQENPPNLDAALNNLGSTYTGLGDMKQNLRRDMPAALADFRQAMQIREDLVNNPPPRQFLPPGDVRKHLAGTYLRVSRILFLLGDPAEAQRHNQLALAICKDLTSAAPEDTGLLVDLAIAHVMAGEAGARLGDPEAPKHLDDAISILAKVRDANPDNPGIKQGLAWAHRVAGEVALATGRMQEAQAHLGPAVILCRERIATDKEGLNVDYQLELASALNRAAVAAERSGEGPTAEAMFREILAIRRKVLAKDPANDRRQMELMTALARCGEHAEAVQMAEKLSAGKKDPELLFEIGRAYSQCATAKGADAATRDRYKRQAMSVIEEAVKLGYKDRVALQTEPDLEPVRDLAGYKDILAAVTTG
jgi:tetratricopeptide (TPR) repeat protein